MLFSLRHVLVTLVVSAVTVTAASDPTSKLSGANSVDGFADLKSKVSTKPATRYIRDFNVTYGNHVSDMPIDAVQVQVDLGDPTGSRDNDVNAGHRGPYVWLTRLHTTDAEAAATSFEVIHTTDPVPGLSDLTAGQAGRYRYLVPKADPDVDRKITKAALFRPKHSLDSPPYGDMLGPDLTDGRGRDFLYLLFATEEASEDIDEA